MKTEIQEQIKSCRDAITKMNRESSQVGYIYTKAYLDALEWVMEGLNK
jgi:hypothetical protein